MQLPFFRKAKATAGAIEVEARTVQETAKPIKAICSHALPDLGDYRIDYPEALPSQLRFLPVFTWSALVIGIGLSAWLFQQRTKLEDSQAAADRRSKAANGTAASLKAELEGLNGKRDDLDVLTRWVAFRYPIRATVAAITLAAADKVQIRSLDIKRRDPNVLRFSIQLSCLGTRAGFDKMRADLLAKLDADGWAVNEVPPDPEDSRLIFDATIARKTT